MMRIEHRALSPSDATLFEDTSEDDLDQIRLLSDDSAAIVWRRLNYPCKIYSDSHWASLLNNNCGPSSFRYWQRAGEPENNEDWLADWKFDVENYMLSKVDYGPLDLVWFVNLSNDIYICSWEIFLRNWFDFLRLQGNPEKMVLCPNSEKFIATDEVIRIWAGTRPLIEW